MKLIISEKYSLAKSIMDAIGTGWKKHGEYFENKDYYVVPLSGHIYELKDIDKYKENKEKNMWDTRNLPFFPNKYEYILKKGGKAKQDAVKKLVKEVDEVIHCGDPDREGQIIVDILLEKVGNKTKVTRPLIKATTKEGVTKAFKERKSNANYKNWYEEGVTRAFIDYDYGLNLSRYAQFKSGTPMNVGRVVGAIITEIYNRDKEIEEFIPRKYYRVISDMEVRLISAKEFDDEEEAQKYADKLNGKKAIVSDLQTKKRNKKRPQLFTLTDLKGVASTRINFDPKKTTQIAQSLYEKGITTYPRTNSRYIATEDEPMVKKAIEVLSDGDLEIKKELFDDSKTEGHSAITPTGKLGNMSEDEKKVFELILNRFKAVFCKDECIVNKTTATIEVDKIEVFKVTGEVLLEEGWSKYEPVTIENPLPPLTIGEEVKTDFKPVYTESKPPAHYTVTTLGNWMQNPFKKEDETEKDEYKNMLAGLEIGTEATRTAMVDKAIKKGYVNLSNKTYTITDRGKFYVETCKQLGIEMTKENTAEMGRMTKEIFNGKRTQKEVLDNVRKEIEKIFNTNATVANRTFNNSIGNCPICGKPIIENKKAFGCSGWKEGCKFVMWKSMFIPGGKVSITEKRAKDLLSGKEITVNNKKLKIINNEVKCKK